MWIHINGIYALHVLNRVKIVVVVVVVAIIHENGFAKEAVEFGWLRRDPVGVIVGFVIITPSQIHHTTVVGPVRMLFGWLTSVVKDDIHGWTVSLP